MAGFPDDYNAIAACVRKSDSLAGDRVLLQKGQVAGKIRLAGPRFTPGGFRGPQADTYFSPHTLVDAQVNHLVPKGRGVSVAAQFLNLNNEVFGFYTGSEKYPIQREYYSPIYSFGLRWTERSEKGSVFHQ